MCMREEAETARASGRVAEVLLKNRPLTDHFDCRPGALGLGSRDKPVSFYLLIDEKSKTPGGQDRAWPKPRSTGYIRSARSASNNWTLRRPDRRTQPAAVPA